ncbi:MAG: hypothetical protein DRR16_15525 [Candidatus Parabeggiatoa sp. nov. 3]|nr:MAG: hypothetical protein DRQ99_28820 [Gammaproteobacteria bacterium]RKZ84161.1 MAG: hypothetical protein DRR16_15525 [Gammaproteobacteria bacterium]
MTDEYGNIQMRLEELKPHPRNVEIYGDENVNDLVEQIRTTGWLKPIVISPEMNIISGHRRWKAAQQLEWERVPVEIQEFESDEDELRRLLNENVNREKTPTQKTREMRLWKTVYNLQRKGKAKRDKKPQDNKRRNVTTQKEAAQKAGISSERLASDLDKVVQYIDDLKSQNKVKAAKILTVFNDDAPTSALRFIIDDDPDGKVLESLASDAVKYEQIMKGDLRLRNIRSALKKPEVAKAVQREVTKPELVKTAQSTKPDKVSDPQYTLLNECITATKALQVLPIQPKDVAQNGQYWKELLECMEWVIKHYKPLC